MDNWKPYALAVGSTVFGWALAQVSSWWSNRGQRQRTKKRMLFYLLELEYLIARMDVEEGVDHLIQAIKGKLGPVFTEADERMIREQVRPLLVRVSIENTAEEIDELEDAYHDAVEELSYIAPFIAYRLKGRTRLFKRFEMVKNLLEKVPDVDPTIKPEQLGALGEFFESLHPKLITEDLKLVRSELVSLSWRIGLVALWKAKRRVRRSEVLSEDDKKDMDDYIDELLSFMMQKYPNGM
jgi:hypothetical protein